MVARVHVGMLSKSSKWKGIVKKLKALGVARMSVTAGPTGGRGSGDLTNAEVAAFHEYGTSRIPARPFIAPAFRDNQVKYRNMLAIAAKKTIGRQASFDFFLRLIGAQMAADQKNYVTQGPPIPPPNAPSTIKAKGSSRTLVDTGAMVNSITYRIVRGGATAEQTPEPKPEV